VLLLAVGAVVGCAPAVHIPLKPEARTALRAARIHAAVGQEEIVPTVEKSNVAAAGGGGLLLALIDAGIESNRMSTANKLIEPIRKEIADFDFRGQFFDGVRATVPALTALKVRAVATGSVYEFKTPPIANAKSREEAAKA
jgi:hypothetical protein